MSDFIKTTMGSQFVIPVYQRNYTWNPEKETYRFMNDLQDLLEGRTANHFLGIIIYLESKISAMFQQLQIVDGQQRLTTCFIFLLALKRVAEEKKDKVVAGMIDDYYLYNRHSDSNAALRLKPAVSTDDVYARLVYGNVRDLSRKEKESGVYRNYDYIHKRITELSRKHSLLELLDCLNRVDILAFPLAETDNAQQIFESINSTGAPLTSADLIRNYVLMNHTDEVQERYYQMYWEPLETYYPESRRLEEFFRFYLAVKTFDLLNRRDVYEGFKNYWNRTEKDTESMLQEINRYCRYYYDIYEGPAENPEIEKALNDFRRTESRMPAPFLMEMYRLYEDGIINEKTLVAEIRLIDSYLIRRALCGYDTGSLSRYFPTLLRSVMNAYKRDNRQDILSLSKVNLITMNRGKSQAMPTDDQLRTQLKEINAYSLMCIRPVLERIEHHGATAAVKTDDLNIEHIMPQNPNNWWKKNCGIDDEDDYPFYVNLIGNLTLCAEYDNSRMGNEDFAFKKKVLSKTLHIRMNTEILKMKHWNKDDILRRCEKLTEEIIRIYPYNGANMEKIRKTQVITEGEEQISLTAPTVNARAINHGKAGVEVLPGSTMKAYGPKEMKKMRTLFLDLQAKGVLHENDNGKIQFAQSWVFSSLNEAAQFLMHRGGENAQAWQVDLRAVEPQKKTPQKKTKSSRKKASSKKKEKQNKTETRRFTSRRKNITIHES